MGITTLPHTPITIDTRYEYEFQYIYAKQYDSGTRFVDATILDDGVAIQVNANTKAVLRYTKSDRKGGLIELGNTASNTVSFELTEQMLAASGKVIVDIELYEDKVLDGKTVRDSISTATFYIEVSRAALTEETIISSNEFSMLVNVLTRCEDVFNRADNLLPEMEQARDDCITATNNINTRFDQIETEFQHIVDTTEDTVNHALAAKASAQAALQSENNAKLSEENAAKSELEASNSATIAYNQADRSQYYAEQAQAASLVSVDAKNTTVSTLTEFNNNINTFRKKTDSIAKSDLTANLQNEIDSKASNETVRLNSIPITEADLDYALALKVNNGGGGSGTPVSGAQIDDTAASYSKVYSSQKTVNYVNTAITSAISGLPKSDNNYTSAEKIKLSRIEDNANYYVHPLTHPSSIINTTPDRQFISEVEKQLYSDKYTKSEVDNMISQISSGIVWKREVPTYNDIITSYPHPEYNWCVSCQEGTFLYNGTEWIKIGSGTIPLATNSNNGLMSSSSFFKLSQIESGANKYVHPASHSADMIVESNTKKFVTPEMYTKLLEFDSTLSSLLSAYRLKTAKILETDLDQAFLDKVANAGGTIINDNVVSTAQTYSSAAIENKFSNVITNSEIDLLFA